MTNAQVKKQGGALFFFWQILLGFFDAAIMIAAGIAVASVAVYFFATPASGELVKRYIPQTSFIYDRTGQHLLYTMYGEENREMIHHNEIPASVRIATIAAEDSAFYSHPGVDPLSIIRALKINLQSDGMRQGGSTITQQLARNAFLGREKTFKRKFLEAIIALKIEHSYSKEEILDMYLNEVPYGSNAYGIQAAAKSFFGKDAKDLTLDESALIAALPKAPTYYSPYGNHADELRSRQRYVLERMKELQLASNEEVDRALAVDTVAKVKSLRNPIEAPHFVFHVIEQLEDQYGREFLETGGLHIYTSLNYDMQQDAERIIAEGAQRNLARGATNAALVAVDPKSGDVLAMVGSRDYFDKSIDGQVNVATRPRQPGSSFKPFAYATAFEKGYQPETKILDAPTNFGTNGGGRPYIPNNYDGRFHGMLTMREALAQSLNVPAVKTLYLAGIDATIEMAHRLGITTLNDRPRYGLSLVLGGGEVKLLDMVGAFSVFANDGVRNPVSVVQKITDGKDKVYFQKQSESKRVLDSQIARKIDSILSDNVARTPIFGPNSPLILPDRVVAAKTGTTQEFRDAWTVGFTPQLAVGVWAGNNNSRSMKAGSDGVFVAAPIWHEFMVKELAGVPEQRFIAYDGQPERGGTGQVAGVSVEKKITYYDADSGKKISEKKAKKMDPEDVEKKIEYITRESKTPPNSNTSIALPDVKDPMYKKWMQGYQDYFKKQDD